MNLTYKTATPCPPTNEWCDQPRPHQHRTWACAPTCLCHDERMAKHLGATT